MHGMMPPMSDDSTAIANELGISDLPVAEQQELIVRFGEVAMKAATVAVLDTLSSEKRDEFMSLAQAGDPASVRAFLDREAPGHEAIAKAAVADELKKFKAAA
jgi:hypothetical protein